MKDRKLLFGIVVLTVGVLFQIQAQDPFTNGLVAYYPFNGNANDASGNGNGGVVYGATLANRFGDRFGNTNSAYYFNGTNSYINIADSPSLNPTTAISVSAWINSAYDGAYNSPAKTNAGIVTKWGADSSMIGQWELRETLSGNPAVPGFSALVMFGGSPPQTGLQADYVTPVFDGQWHQILMTYDGAALILYRDGKVVASQVGGAGTLAAYAQAVEIGRTVHGANGSDSYFIGGIDDVRIYNRALSTNQVQQLYLYESQTHYNGPFQIVAGAFNWSEAEPDAQSRGGHLATFGTQAKWNSLVNECGSRIVVDAWIGAYQPTGSPGNWTWITGEPWTFAPWWPGDPKNQAGLDYVAVCFAGVVGWSNARWNDTYSSGGFSYILELQPRVDLIKAVKPSFSNLLLSTNYQLQVSGDLNTWTNHGSPFTATNTSMIYPQYWDVDNWGQLFFRLQVAP